MGSLAPGLALTPFLTQGARAQAVASPTVTEDAYTVRNVAVDVTAASAVAARDQAILQAEHKGFAELATRYGETPAQIARVGDREIALMVQGFEVQSEQTSAVRYVGTLTIRFKLAAVRARFGTTAMTHLRPAQPPVETASAATPIAAEPAPTAPGGASSLDTPTPMTGAAAPPGPGGASALSPSTATAATAISAAATPTAPVTKSKPVLVLPVLQTGSSDPVLWEDRTSWRSAWENLASTKGLVPILVPAGELDDIADISAKEAVSGAAAPLTKIGTRYGAAEVVVAFVQVSGRTVDPATGFTVTLVHQAIDPSYQGLTSPTPSVVVPPVEHETGSRLLTRSVKAVITTLEDEWRRADTGGTAPAPMAPAVAAAAAPPGAAQNRIVVTIPLQSLGDWLETRRRLGQVGAVVRADVLGLSKEQARVALSFAGDADGLRNALAGQDLALSPAGGADDTSRAMAQSPGFGGSGVLVTPLVGSGAAAAPQADYELRWMRGAELAAPTRP
ncbi:MAG: DUF2066 domain-containing protein [Azospirillaceae bacterium]|nr:DUF2066 domain-containing protein [Azospirillaceae bacterium]